MQFRSINPYNGRILNTFDGHTKQQIESKIKSAHLAYLQWENTTFKDRAELMQKAGQELIKNKKKYSESITLEMGKPIKEALAEIEKCAKVCSYYAEKSSEFLQDTPLDTPHGNGYIHYNPIGVVLAVMPWNFPFWQVFRFAAPAIMAGNTCILKHASNVAQSDRVAIEQWRNSGGWGTIVSEVWLIKK
jgi:succinate-semialdehyde dehydrogenase/glutarate-semialdehyde dehydrogenase